MTENDITESTIVTRSSEVVSSKVGDELALMSLDRGEFYLANPTTAAVWRLLEEPVGVGDLCKTLEHEYDVSSRECQEDLLELLAALLDLELVRRVE